MSMLGGETLGGSQRSLHRHGAGSGRMMHHSHSTPAGVDSAGAGTSSLGRSSAAGTPRKGGKMLAIRVLMLDETSTIFQIQSKALGRVLFEQVCRQLNLLEEDYFGLEYEEHGGTKYWLDLEKPICRQVGFSLADPFLRFCVKFYTPDPGQLEEEFTRYLFCLQIKRDLSNGSLTCNAHTAALLSSYIVQSECGDYVAEDYPNHTYLSHYKFTPRQDDALERRIMENHKKHTGQSPAQADMNLLETARRCESYGMKMHPAKDHEGVPLNLAVAHMGIVVFQNITKINTFSWAKIRKISFKRKRFLIKLHHDAYGYYKEIMEFFFEGRNECKNFWKKCVENHGFFRCTTVKRVPRQKTRVLSRGSSFRYSGKTQRQMVEYVRDNYVKRQTFQRSQSFRHSSAGLTSMSASSAHSVNASISAHPLLPLADPVELTCQLPSWSSTSGSRTTTEMAVSPRRSTRTACTSSPEHPLASAAITHNNIQVETHAAPAASNNNTSTVAQTTSASQASINLSEQERRSRSQSKSPEEESSNARAALIHAARSRHPNTGQSPHRVIANTIRSSSPILILQQHRAAATNTPPTPPPRRTTTPTVATNTRVDTITSSLAETHPCNHGTRSLPRDSSLDRTYLGDWGTRYQALSTGDLPETRTPQQRRSSERLEYELSRANLYSAMSYHLNGTARHPWQRSASCRDLYDFSFEETGRAKRRGTEGLICEFLSVNRIDSPITRYDDSRKILYGSRMTTSLDIDRDFVMPDHKVYSSSYPGTTCASIDEPLGCPFELSASHDDISHDSYELLEKSDEENFYRMKRSKSDYGHTRSCSLDSGNYLPSDDSVSEADCKNRTALDVKSRSVNDMQLDTFSSMEDPRYLPREKMCVKSDGNFYREIQKMMRSRTSSQDSQSEFYDSKLSKSSQDSSKKSRDSVYHTDSKKSRETLKSKSSDRSGYNSRASSQESKSGSYDLVDNSKESNTHVYNEISRASSQESKSDYYDARMSPSELDKVTLATAGDEFAYDYNQFKQKVKSHDSLLSDLKDTTKTQFYDTNSTYSTIPSSGKHKETSHVHSISLQNVETEQHMRAHGYKKSDPDKLNVTVEEDSRKKTTTTHIWPESIAGICTEIKETRKDRCQMYRNRSQDSENIFSFDKDKIESLTGISDDRADDYNMPDVVMSNTVLPSEFDKLRDSPSALAPKKDTRKEDLIAKTHFDEYNPKLILDSNTAQGTMLPLTYTHATVERTKSDPNSLANRARLGSNSRRHMLMHQKSIDLTPADSSDEDYIYRQIPSAPPVCKTHGHFDLPKSPYESVPEKHKTNFELPKSYFKEFDDRKYIRDSARVEPEFANDLTKVDIPYVLHKRHVMNGTAPTPLEFSSRPKTKPRSPKSPKGETKSTPKDARKNSIPKSDERNTCLAEDLPGFLFTQNIDLSKINPITLEVTKTQAPTQFITSPKRDITEHMDPALLETLNSKLSQIESDSATSSKTESLHPVIPKYMSKIDGKSKTSDYNNSKLSNISNKNDIKGNKRIIKPRMQPNKKIIKNKTKQKMRITSFSSDDESLDSDDVFGSTEATPTRLEFSPPQSRKDMEPILQVEYDKITSGVWHRGQTMSSTEIEGSPPQCRRLVELESRYNPPALEPPQAHGGPELRRISERSISIPSSEDDFMLNNRQNGEVFADQHGYHENIPSPILESCEFLRTDDEVYETCPEDRKDASDYDIPYTLITKTVHNDKSPFKTNEISEPVKTTTNITSKMPSRSKIMEELTEMPRKGHTAILFAHARLNLSEGSAFASLQRQKATQESPNAGRRAKSLDNPVISLHRLPPMNAFSSKDDTVDFNEEGELLEEKSIEDNDSQEYNLVTNEMEILNKPVDLFLESITLDEGELELLEKQRLVKHVRPNLVIKTKSGKITKTQKYVDKDWGSKGSLKKLDSEKSPTKSPQRSKLVTQQSLPIPKISKKSSPKGKTKKSLTGQKSLPSNDKFDSDISRSKSPDKTLMSQLSVPSETYIKSGNERPDKLGLPDLVKKPKTLDLEQPKRSKEITRSTEKLEIKKSNSKERSRSQEESDADIEKRKEKQQQLYESAMKQTIISPVKDIPPAFPAPEDKILVKTDGEKIIIETDIKSKPEDHVFIAKSPKKLESTLTKISKSFEDTKMQVEKIPKPNRSFDDRSSPSFDEKGRDDESTGADVQKSPGKISRSRELKKQIEGSVVHKNINGKSKSLDKKDETHRIDTTLKSKSLEDYVDTDKVSPESTPRSKGSSPKSPKRHNDNKEAIKEVTVKGTKLNVWYSRVDAGPAVQKSETYYDVVSKGIQIDPSEADTQAVISERRKLDLLKRQSLKSEEETELNNTNILEQKASEEESLTEVSDIKAEQNSDDSGMFIVLKSDLYQPESHQAPGSDSNFLMVDKDDELRKLRTERSRSEDTGSWITVDYEECVGDDDFSISDHEDEQFQTKHEFASQDTLEDTDVKLEDDKFTDMDDYYKNIIITPPQDISPIIEINTFPEPAQIDDKVLNDSVEKSYRHRRSKSDFRKLNIERSKSSETSGSWTSGEKDISPSRDSFIDRQDSSPCSSKDKGSLDDESSVSCSISRPFGISQDLDKFDRFDKIRCDRLRESMLEVDEDLTHKDIPQPTQSIKPKPKPVPLELPSLDLPIQPARKLSTPTLEKQFTIDIESGSELENDFVMIGRKSALEKVCKIEESESSSSASSSQRKDKSSIQTSLHKRISRNPKIELTLSIDSNPDIERTNGRKLISDKLLRCRDKKSSLESRSSLESKASLSVESRGSFETESSSGSLGAAQRKGELAQKEQQSTWRPFLIESSGSSSLEEGWLPTDHDENLVREPYDFSSQRGIDDFQTFTTKEKNTENQKAPEVSFQENSTNFSYPSSNSGSSSTSTLTVGSSDVLVGYSSTFALARTLSRISERSTTSEKSSIDEDSTKASSHSESVRDESIISSDHQASLSSDPSNTNLAYISDTDRRTSAEMPDIPCDPAHPDRLSQLYASAQNAIAQQSVVRTGRFSVTHVNERSSPGTENDNKSKLMKSAGSSQDSEDWPLPDIPKDAEDALEEEEADDQFALYNIRDRPIPKTFGWRSNSVRSQDSDNWPSPPSSVLDTPIVDDVEGYYAERPGSVTQVMVDSFTEHTPDDHSRDSDGNEDMTFNDDHSPGVSKDSDVSAVSPCTERKISRSPVIAQVLPYEDTAYLMPDDARDMQVSEQSSSCLGMTLGSATCFRSTFSTSKSCCSSENAVPQQYTTDADDLVIVEQPTRSPQNHSPISEEEAFGNDDVFRPGTVKIEISPDGDDIKSFVKLSHGSNNSDTSIDDMLSAFTEEAILRNRESRSSVGSGKKYSHSSHSEEETSSFGTDMDGTVKMGLQPKKCTHSSHSEDTSVGLSISEWSTGTNTVRQYTNLSASESLSGNKSEKSSGNVTSSNLSSSGFKSSESLSGSKSRLSLENLPEDVRYDPLTNSDTTERISSGTKSDDTTSTLTEMVHTISEWSSSTTDTLVPFDESQILADKFTKKLPKGGPLSDKLEIRYEKLSPTEKHGKRQSLQFTHDIPSEEAAKKKSPDPADESSTKETKSTERPVKIPITTIAEKPPISRKPIEKISRYNKNNENNGGFKEQLYSLEDKLTSRYQSQEFVQPPVKHTDSPENNKLSSRVMEAYDKPLIKHHSYDDKTLSKHQIREYQNARIVSKSHSFHEHLLRHSESPQESTSQDFNGTTTTTGSSNPPDRPGRLSKNTTYYSSSLSSESPPIHPAQPIAKPPRKTAAPRSILPKSPPSGNDTDSSLDFMQQNPRGPARRGYRRRRQPPARKRADRAALAACTRRDMESSEEYFPELESGSSDIADRPQYPDFDEELEGDQEYQPDECYPSYSASGFEGLDFSSSNVDEMGFPRYDRLRSLGYAKVDTKPPKSSRKRQLRREESLMTGARYTPEESGNDVQGAGLSDDPCGSSEDSFTQGYAPGSARQSYFATTFDGSSFDTSEPFDLSALPPPLFNPNELDEELSDEFQ